MPNDEVQQFAERLRAELDARRIASRSGYLHPEALQECIQKAAHPTGSTSEFPRMLYLNGDRDRYRIVENSEQEAAAAEEGYIREAGPQYEEGYPLSLLSWHP
jgi:hypothetical protein